MSEVPEDMERWTAGRRLALVLEILAGKVSVQEAARQHGLTVADVEEWKERALEAAKNGLRSRPKDLPRQHPEEIVDASLDEGGLLRVVIRTSDGDEEVFAATVADHWWTETSTVVASSVPSSTLP